MDRLIQQLTQGHHLSADEVATAAEFLLDHEASVEKKADFLRALSIKGETAGEVADFVNIFLNYAVNPGFDQMGLEGPSIDVCGTGGDKLNLFNISTTSMFVVAAGGAIVVKHGNRGITSKSGGADVLEALGISIDLPLERIRECLQEARLTFLFAPAFHPAFKAVVPVRQTLAKEGVRTIFNLVGPLLNPTRPSYQLVGVMAPELVSTFADILQRLGRKSAWVVNGATADGQPVDELSLMGPTRIIKTGSQLDSVDETITPADLGLSVAKTEDLRGGEAQENAEILEAILSGKEQGPKRDIVLLNAGAALTCAGLTPDLPAGIARAREIITSGAALEKLRLLQQLAK